MRIYVDMDDTLFDFKGAHLEALKKCPDIKYPQSQYGFWERLKLLPMAKSAMWLLNRNFDLRIATAPSVINPLCYTEKRNSIENTFGPQFLDKLIIIPDKSLAVMSNTNYNLEQKFLSFSVNGVAGVIDEQKREITVTLPQGTGLSDLQVEFELPDNPYATSDPNTINDFKVNIPDGFLGVSNDWIASDTIIDFPSSGFQTFVIQDWTDISGRGIPMSSYVVKIEEGTGTGTGNQTLVNIPDDNFREYLKATYPNAMQGEQLIVEEAEKITGDFDCSFPIMSGLNLQPIEDFTGIEYFTDITSLNAMGNRINTLPFDLSKNTALTSVNLILNALSFEDLLPLANRSFSSFEYKDQVLEELSTQPYDMQTVKPGADVTFDFTFSDTSAGIEYTWIGGGMNILTNNDILDVTTSPTLNINNIPTDYLNTMIVCNITHPSLPDLTFMKIDMVLIINSDKNNNTDQKFLTFSLNGVQGNIDHDNREIEVILPVGTDLSALTTEFTLPPIPNATPDPNRPGFHEYKVGLPGWDGPTFNDWIASGDDVDFSERGSLTFIIQDWSQGIDKLIYSSYQVNVTLGTNAAPAWNPVVGGPDNHTIVLPQNLATDIEGQPLEKGDYIGIFFKDATDQLYNAGRGRMERRKILL